MSLLLSLITALTLLSTPVDNTSREAQLAKLKAKVQAGKPLIAHVLVPLCDNEHQGIVKVNSRLGDGTNLRTNLYWGAGYGIKTHFSRLQSWKLIQSEKPTSGPILERCLFERKLPNGTRIQLVAEAYDGSKMAICLQHYMSYLSGKSDKTWALSDQTSLTYGAGADLIAFNGHNGLMDEWAAMPRAKDARNRDAVIIGCISKDYFMEYIQGAGAYPLITTTGLMAPEAYTLAAVLESWGKLKSGKEIRAAAGAAYHQYQKCGLRGATNLFHTGW